ncbi:MAG: hypothetical protein ACK5PW_04095 [Burkholderiales bacterium]|jgi:hypothetical protein
MGASVTVDFVKIENSISVSATVSAEPTFGVVVERIDVIVDVRVRKKTDSPVALLRRAGVAFIEHLEPWGGPLMGMPTKTFLGSVGQEFDVEQFRPGVSAVLGVEGAPASIRVFFPNSTGAVGMDEPILRVQLVLLKEGCIANGIGSRVALEGANGREVFGRYIHLSSEKARAGDLNARIKREIARALQKVVAKSSTAAP